jgi:hypothetical protein
VGDPFKDTSSVAMNPVIKFTTLFGLLAVELAVSLSAERGSGFTTVLAAVFFLVSAIFVWRSFYGMRIKVERAGAGAPAMAKHKPVVAMDRSGLIVSLVAQLVGLAVGAAALSWWEGGRQSADIETLKVRLADERGVVQAKVKQLTDELNAEKQRREALEQVIEQQKTKRR